MKKPGRVLRLLQLTKCVLERCLPFRVHSESLRRPGGYPCLVSPANHLRCFYTLRSMVERRGATLDALRSLYGAAIAKFEDTQQQMSELRTERTELKPKIEEVERQIVEEEARLDGLLLRRDDGQEGLEAREAQLEDTTRRRDGLRADYDGIMVPLENELKGEREGGSRLEKIKFGRCFRYT